MNKFLILLLFGFISRCVLSLVNKSNEENGAMDIEFISEEIKTLTNTDLNLKWISQPLREGLINLRVKSKGNQECNIQWALYEIHLRNQTVWAVQMSESSQSEPIGLLGGTTYQMGNFEECIKIRAYGVRGQYCLAKFHYSLNPEYQNRYDAMIEKNDFRDIDPESTIWENLVRLKNDPTRINRQDLYWALCIPASCTPEDLQYSLDYSLVPHFQQHHLELKINVDPIYCHTSDHLPLTTGFWVTIIIMVILLSVNILSTLYDGYEYLQSNYTHEIKGWKEVVGAFSLWRNTYNLGTYKKSSQNKIANGMKLTMMILILYGHILLYIWAYPQFNPVDMEEMHRRGRNIVLVNTNIVDAFFTVSGFITFYYGFKSVKFEGKISLVRNILFRLILAFGIIIAYVVFVLPHTGNGPIWKARIFLESEYCRKNWWLDILLLNNFFNVDEQCVVISWYITADMLLYIIASVLMYLIAKEPKFGIFLSISTLVISILITFWVTYVNKYSGILKLYMNFLSNYRKSAEFKGLYIALYTRIGPYLIGFLAAYLTQKLQEIKFKFSQKTVIIGCIMVIIIGEGSQYFGILFYQLGRPYFPVENALYSCLHRVLFSGIFAWFLMVYSTTGFGLLNSFINCRLITVLGQLTYSVFLVNTLLLITFTASIRTPLFYSFNVFIIIVLGNITATYIFGFFFYLYAEAPISRICKILKEKTKAKIESKVQENQDIKVDMEAENKLLSL